MNRSEILQTADGYINGDRDEQYGTPENSFRTIASLWEPYIKTRCASPDSDICIQPGDVANMMILFKVARNASGEPKLDNYIDIAGYAACGGEIQSVSDIANPITDKPVEPWGSSDTLRMSQVVCSKSVCNECHIPNCYNGKHHLFCGDWSKSHPAEARKIMDEMEGKLK